MIIAPGADPWGYPTGGDHIVRWAAAGLFEAGKKLRHVKGYRELEALHRRLNPSSTPQEQVA